MGCGVPVGPRMVYINNWTQDVLLLTPRVVLGIMAFFMFLVTQMIRSNLYIAIVAMVEDTTNDTLNSTDGLQKLQWDENYKGILLGSFYWCYWITELPGGILAQRFGGRSILGVSVLAAGLTNCLFPMAAKIHPILAAIVRAFQGLALGVTWPAMHCLSAKWIPKTERSKFMASYHGAALGTSITYPLCGILIASFGWECVFYVTGLVTVIWAVVWWNLVYDSPEHHPKISNTEKEYLDTAISTTVVKTQGFQTPWRSILASGPFWAVLFASQGVIWGVITMSMQLPAYFHDIHNLDIKTNGLLLGIPDLFKLFFGLSFSTLMDYLLKTERLSITAVRKIAVGVSEIIPAILLILLGYYGSSNHFVALTFITLLIAVGGASSSGNLANIVDITPNYAGIVLGLVKTLCVIPGVISPIIVSAIVSKDKHSSNEWFIVLAIAAGVQFVTCLVFLLLGSGEVQAWNQPKKDSLDDVVESENLVGTARTAVTIEPKS